MLENFKSSTANQYHAVFETFRQCIELGGVENWSMKIGNYELGRCVFHALFFGDLYLNQGDEAFRGQKFHRDHAEIFENYAELDFGKEPGPAPNRDETILYLNNCFALADEVVGAETEESLGKRAPYQWTEFSMLEMHLYNLRHLQHHAAQIGLRLRAEAAIELPWVKTRAS